MGEDYIIANLDKKEFIDVGTLGLNSRFDSLFELPGSGMLAWLIAERARIGDYDLLGTWAGNRIIAAGDCGAAEPLYDTATKPGSEWRDITVPCFEEFLKSEPILLEDYIAVGMIEDGRFRREWATRRQAWERSEEEDPAKRIEIRSQWLQTMSKYHSNMSKFYEQAVPWRPLPSLPIPPTEP